MKKINVAVVGTGSWGKNLIRNFHFLANLFGVCDCNQAIATEVAKQYRTKSLTWEEILSNELIDAVIIATNKSHYPLAKEALLANKHVFVEKPLAPTVEQAKDLYNISLKVNKKLMIGHLMQYHPAFIKLKQICASGSLGEIFYAYSNRLAFGKFMPEEDVLLSLASHDVSMMLALMDQPKFITSIKDSFLANKIVDQANIRLKFTESKLGHIFVSWFHPVKERKFVVIASKGMAVFDDLADWDHKLCIYYHDLNLEVNSKNNNIFNLSPQNLKLKNIKIPEQQEPLFNEAKHFIKCIQNDLTPYTDGKEAIAVLQVIEQASKQANARTEN